jgi:predicted nucleic acid-binding protein
MRHLLDTGILVRIPHRTDPLNPEIRQALRRLAGSGHSFVTTRQNIAEFWNVCTRPMSARGGFGLSPDETARRLRMLERFVLVLSEPDSAYARWKALVQKHNVLGRQVHDARIVSVMAAHRIKRIVTLNETDFVRYAPEVIALTPGAILSLATRE